MNEALVCLRDRLNECLDHLKSTADNLKGSATDSTIDVRSVPNGKIHTHSLSLFSSSSSSSSYLSSSLSITRTHSLTLTQGTASRPVLECVTGAGNHSLGESKIKPAVEQLVAQLGLVSQPKSAGSFLIFV